MTADMGEISVDFELENPVDHELLERGLGEQSTVRRARVQGVVDTGAMMLVLPQNIVERLGLRIQDTVVVTYADNRREERPVAGPVAPYSLLTPTPSAVYGDNLPRPTACTTTADGWLPFYARCTSVVAAVSVLE